MHLEGIEHIYSLSDSWFYCNCKTKSLKLIRIGRKQSYYNFITSSGISWNLPVISYDDKAQVLHVVLFSRHYCILFIYFILRNTQSVYVYFSVHAYGILNIILSRVALSATSILIPGN